MPILAALGTALAGGASYLTGRANRREQRAQNVADRQHSWDMYHTQRNDALADWERQNLYNSPAQQMQRLREAGLNAHMMYGGGAQMTGSMVRSAQASPHSQPAAKMNEGILPQVINDIFQNVNAIWQGKQIQANTDNLRTQNEVLLKDLLLKDQEGKRRTQEYRQADRMNELDYQRAKQDIELRDLDIKQRPYDLRKIEAETRKLEAETKETLTDNEIKQLMKAPNLRLAIQELFKKRQDTINAETEGMIKLEELSQAENDSIIKDIQRKLAEDGVSMSDPYYYRLLFQMWLRALGYNK